MGTITVNIKDEVEKEFRAVASIAHREEKGYLEKAVTEAMQRWIEGTCLANHKITQIFTKKYEDVKHKM